LTYYEKEVEFDNKLNKYLKIIGIIYNVFRPQKTSKKTRIKLHNTLAVPASLYSIENWNIKARDARRITTGEMRYITKTVGYTWTDYKTNKKIAEEII